MRKIFLKTNISYSLIRTRLCAYQGVKNISFYENFAYVLNDPKPDNWLAEKTRNVILDIKFQLLIKNFKNFS